MASFIARLASVLRPDRPRWACEFTRRAVVVVGASPDRRNIASSASVALPPGALRPGIKATNLADAGAVSDTLKRALEQAGFVGSELAVVVPDDTVKISLVEAASFPGSEEERVAFIRWKLKKHMPFDVSTAAIAYQKLSENGVVEVIAVVSPASVVEQYEAVVDALGVHAGAVSPSGPSALNLLDADAGDILFVKLGGDTVVTAVLTDGRLRFYRNVPSAGSLDASVYPTLMYYQDKLSEREGQTLRKMVLVGEGFYPDDTRAAASKLGLTVSSLYSSGIEDIYKPALGALQG